MMKNLCRVWCCLIEQELIFQWACFSPCVYSFRGCTACYRSHSMCLACWSNAWLFSLPVLSLLPYGQMGQIWSMILLNIETRLPHSFCPRVFLYKVRVIVNLCRFHDSFALSAQLLEHAFAIIFPLTPYKCHCSLQSDGWVDHQWIRVLREWIQCWLPWRLCSRMSFLPHLVLIKASLPAAENVQSPGGLAGHSAGPAWTHLVFSEGTSPCYHTHFLGIVFSLNMSDWLRSGSAHAWRG